MEVSTWVIWPTVSICIRRSCTYHIYVLMKVLGIICLDASAYAVNIYIRTDRTWALCLLSNMSTPWLSSGICWYPAVCQWIRNSNSSVSTIICHLCTRSPILRLHRSISPDKVFCILLLPLSYITIIFSSFLVLFFPVATILWPSCSVPFHQSSLSFSYHCSRQQECMLLQLTVPIAFPLCQLPQAKNPRKWST